MKVYVQPKEDVEKDVLISLEQTPNGVTVNATHGKDCWSILGINNDGTIVRFGCISNRFSFPLDKYGKVIIL